MSEQTYKPKIGDKAMVKPKPYGDGKNPRLIPYPPTAKPPRYLPPDVFTRVRMDDYLVDVFAQGDLEVRQVDPPATSTASPQKPTTKNQKPLDGGE